LKTKTRISDIRISDIRISDIRISDIRLVIHCNEVEVLNFLMSDSTCKDTTWRNNWRGKVAKIKFNPSDENASYYYRPITGNRCKSTEK
jgi:hypothetical protein